MAKRKPWGMKALYVPCLNLRIPCNGREDHGELQTLADSSKRQQRQSLLAAPSMTAVSQRP